MANLETQVDGEFCIKGDTQEEIRASAFMAAYKVTNALMAGLLEHTHKITNGQLSTGEVAYIAMGAALSALQIIAAASAKERDMEKVSDDQILLAAIQVTKTCSFDKAVDDSIFTMTGPISLAETLKDFKSLRGFDIDHLLNEDMVKGGRDEKLVSTAKAEAAKMLN